MANDAAPFASLGAAAEGVAPGARARLSPRRLLARLANAAEPALAALVTHGFTPDLADAYHAAWLHSGQRVSIAAEGGGGEGATKEVTIDRLSDAGFLLARTAGGDAVELHPDANSLDMMAGLVARKG